MKYWRKEILFPGKTSRVLFLISQFILFSYLKYVKGFLYSRYENVNILYHKREPFFLLFLFFFSFLVKYSFRRNTIDVVRANKQMDVFECHYLMYNDIISFMKNSAVWAALVKEKEEVGKKK